MNRVAALAVLALVLGGCLRSGSQAPEPGGQDAAAADRLFGPETLVLDCNADCGKPEPTIAWLADGTIVVSRSNGAAVLRSTDGGRSFTVVDVPPHEASGTYGSLATLVGDGQLQMGPDGTLWFSYLLTGRVAGGGGGVRVLSSDDAGLTWKTDTFVQTNANPITNSADRQWLAFRGTAVLLLAVAPPGGAPTLYQSDDDGASFGLVGPIVTAEPRNTPWGLPVVFQGRLQVPYFSPPCTGPTTGLSSMHVASEPSEGSLIWDSQQVDTAAVVPCGFPLAATNGSVVAVAWNHRPSNTPGWETAGTAIAMSDDGMTWSEPVRWGPHEARFPHPWIEALPDGRFAVVAHSTSGEVILMIGGQEGPQQTWRLGSTTGETDLPHLAVGPDGRIAVTWVRDGDVFARVQNPWASSH